MHALLSAVLACFLFLSFPLQTFAAEKPYWRSDLNEGARRLEVSVKRDAAVRAKSPADLRKEIDAAANAKDPKLTAVRLGELAGQSPNDIAVWLRLARTLLVIPAVNATERNEYRDRALGAAYIAYRRASAKNDEADALAIIGRVYADRQLWRASIDTLKASLELREVAELRTLYEKIREENGFRLLDYTVDSESSAPRACIQFSEVLAKRVDYSPFVSVKGVQKAAVSAQDRQLCVDGLRHGDSFEITVRSGVPSANGETLRRPVDLTVYVRDRKPNARFTGRAYVLPRTGQRGIPIISTNTNKVGVEIFRIGDRALVPFALDGQFRQNLEGYEANRIAQSRGERIYKGELEVASELNKDVTTAFPVDEALGNLAPGVYAMTAGILGAVKSGDDEEDFTTRATQWFVVSDLGMTSVSSNDGLDVMVRSLGNAQPVADAEVRLVAKNNEVLATRKTDAQGAARFEAGLAKGTGGAAPAAVIAEKKPGDYAFLSFSESPFDFSDRGVGGRATPGALDAMLFTERGVYRTGETVRLTALLRDPRARAVSNVPLTFIVTRPNGVEDRRQTIKEDEIGGRSMDIPLLGGAMTGTWRIRAYTDPKSPAIGEAAFLVEDYVPDRIEFFLKTAATEIARGKPVTVDLDGRYLFGTPTANFDLEGEIEVRTTTSRPGLQGYRFGLADDEFTTVRRPLNDLPRTDAKGHSALPVELPVVAKSSRPLEAQILVRMAEPGGRAMERTLRLPVKPEAAMIGVRPLFNGRANEGENAGFEIVLADTDGKLTARNGLKWELLRIETRYQWYRSGGSWDYEPVRSTRKVADGRIDTLATGPAKIGSPVTYGRYRLEVSTGEANGPVTSINFDAGWAGEATADTPDRLEVSLDKEEYAPGDTITVTLSPRTAGSATIMVVGDKMFARSFVQNASAGTKATFKVSEDWGPGAYVVAFHHRPMDVAASRMPGRSVGVSWFGVAREQRTLQVKLDAPAQIRPRTQMTVPVTISGLAAGETARVTLAAVDVGILNLTNYQPPEPTEHFLGQRRLSGEVRDLYGALIDGMQGVRGRIRSGGDEGGMQLGANPPAQAPLALYSGIVTVDAQGKANVTFDVPAFDGTARLMATAWTASKLGEASTDVIIRDPVVLTTTLPRFLGVGDRSTLRIDVNNVEGAAGDYTLEVMPGGVAEAEGGARTVNLAAKGSTGIALPLTGKGAGLGNVKVRIAGGGLSIERDYALGVRPAYPPIERRTVRTLARGESITVGPELLSDVVAGSGAVSLSVTPTGAIDVPSLLLSLDRYPFGCSEQVVSRALPLLYLNELAAESNLALDKGADERIRESIARVLSRQSADGSIGLWAASTEGGTDVWLHAYVTDFLTRAKEKGFHVPDGAFRQALERLRNSVNISRDLSEGGEGVAYALYVLARNSIAPVGDIRYLADVKLENIETPLAKGQIGAALALLGDKGRAEKVFGAALEALPRQAAAPDGGRADYGSDLRDGAALATLATEAGVDRIARAAFTRIDAQRKMTPRTSTQEQVWMVLAARALAKDSAGLRLEIDGAEHNGAYFKTLRRAELAGKSVRIANRGERPVQLAIGIQGSPVTAEPAEEKGFKLTRSYFTLDGKPADISKVTQNQRLAVVLKVTEGENLGARVVLADYLPAGFEIDNPRLVESASGALSWAGEMSETEYTEFRDERFVAAFNRGSDSKPINVAYIVRAVSPGRYVHPPAIVEDMYRPDRFARTAAGSVEIVPAGR